MRSTWLVMSLSAISWAMTSAQAQSVLSALDAGGPITYFVEEGAPDSGYRDGDRQLAAWALDNWARSAGGALTFEAADAATALIQVHWVRAEDGRYGEMTPLLVNGRRGAAVHIRPDTEGLGPAISLRAREDPLMRDTIVYLTCLHELGHALGLAHTADYADIMYAFGYGGDIPAYFGRYRDRLSSRADIAKVSGLSGEDVRRLRALYPRTPTR
jgi:hypothetical protein